MIAMIAAFALSGQLGRVHSVVMPAPRPEDFVGRNVDQALWGVPTITGGDFELLYSTPRRYGEYQGMEVEVRIRGGGTRHLDFPLMAHRDGLWERVRVQRVEVGP